MYLTATCLTAILKPSKYGIGPHLPVRLEEANRISMTAAQRRIFWTLTIANFCLFFGLNVWRSVFNNLAVEELHIEAAQIGFIQSIREVPGLIGFVLGFLALLFTEMTILNLSVVLLGVGLIATGWADQLSTLIIATVVMSIGFHFFVPSSSSMVLMISKKAHAPRALGRLKSVSALAAVAATILVFFTVKAWGYRWLLTVTGGLVIAGGLITLIIGRGQTGLRERRKVVFRRRYLLYYVLTLLMGCRRHIFTTFAVFLLVRVHGISAQETAILYLVNNLINTYASGQLGRLVAHFGERTTLTVNFLLLIGIFLGYAYIPFLPVLYLLFIADSILFGFSLALNTYFQKIAITPKEITSNLAMGQTINHVAALFVPVLGGLIWEAYGPAATFLAGAAVVAVSLICTQWIRTGPALQPVSVAVQGK